MDKTTARADRAHKARFKPRGNIKGITLLMAAQQKRDAALIARLARR